MTRRAALLCALTIATATGLVGNAWALTTVSRSGNTITITGDDGVNFVQNVGSNYEQVFYQDLNGIAPGPGCVNDTGQGVPQTVWCGAADPGLVANVSLGGGDDTFYGDRGPEIRDVVDLGAGNDLVLGSGLNDTLNGGPGDDKIVAGFGDDTIDGGEGADNLHGSAGNDTVTGGPGRDSLNGDGQGSNDGLAAGNDTLQARDGEVDALACGFGADTAVADSVDVFDVMGDCESLDRAATPAAGAPASATTGRPAETEGSLSVRVGVPKSTRLRPLLAGKAIAFRVGFSGPCQATLGIVLRAAEARRLGIGTKATVIAADTAAVPEAGAFAGSLKLIAKYRKKLSKARRVTAYLVLLCEGADGSSPTAARKIVLRR